MPATAVDASRAAADFIRARRSTLAVVDRGSVAPLPASPMVHSSGAVSDPNLAAPNMAKTAIVDKRRSCSCAIASASTLKDGRCRSGVAWAWQ
jgi:hypothetical protein